MSAGELAFLALALGCCAVFAVSVIWLRMDYVKFREQRPSSNARPQAKMAE